MGRTITGRKVTGRTVLRLHLCLPHQHLRLTFLPRACLLPYPLAMVVPFPLSLKPLTPFPFPIVAPFPIYLYPSIPFPITHSPSLSLFHLPLSPSPISPSLPLPFSHLPLSHPPFPFHPFTSANTPRQMDDKERLDTRNHTQRQPGTLGLRVANSQLPATISGARLMD